MISRRWMFLACLLCTLPVAGQAGSLVSSMPVARVFPAPGGILYPGYDIAAGVNPAAIPLMGKGTAIQLAGTPGYQSGDPTDLFGAVAMTHGSLGFGAGYTGSVFNSWFTHGGFAGIGYNLDPMSVGVAVRDPDINGNYAAVDAGLEFETKSEITLGAVLYDINHNTQPDIGIGTKSGKKYNLEADVLFPPFNSSGLGYVGTLSTSIMPGAVGFHFSTSYATASKAWDYLVGVGAMLSENINVVLQYATTRRATAALTVIL